MKVCQTKRKYFGNATNMRNHAIRRGAELMLALATSSTDQPDH